MKIFKAEATTKLCNCSPGDVISLWDNNTGLCEGYFLICMLGEEFKKKSNTFGLYAAENDLFLVNLQTGGTKKMPHLSSKIKIEHRAYLSFSQGIHDE